MTGSSENGESLAPRRVADVRPGSAPHWVGDGFPVRTMLSYDRDAVAASPFLLLDYAAPREFPPTEERRGVGAHPHRGFETVTIAFSGEVEHRDSAGNRGRIGPGDVQWMTAASGVLHEEYHGRDFARRGGTFEVAQVWVDLPARLKMSPPRYQDIVDADIPTVALPGGAGRVRVIAGECLGARGPASTFTPVEMWDVRLAAGAAADLALPAGHNAVLLVRRGPVTVGGTTRVAVGHVVFLARGGGGVRLESADAAEVLVLGGEPLDQTVVGRGPFVMNTAAEVAQAYRDVADGRFGHLD